MDGGEQLGLSSWSKEAERWINGRPVVSWKGRVGQKLAKSGREVAKTVNQKGRSVDVPAPAGRLHVNKTLWDQQWSAGGGERALWAPSWGPEVAR